MNMKLCMLTLAVATDTSFMICSKRAVSSACRCMCSEIFSLNLRGFAMSAAARARVSAWRADSGWAHTRVYATTRQRGGSWGATARWRSHCTCTRGRKTGTRRRPRRMTTPPAATTATTAKRAMQHNAHTTHSSLR